MKKTVREIFCLHRFINACHQPHPSFYYVMTKLTYFINISDIVRSYYIHWGMSQMLLLKDKILRLRLILCCKSTNPYKLGTQWLGLGQGI